jgi:hypothetical protein
MEIDNVCGKDRPRHLYCGAIFKAEIPDFAPEYDPRTEGGRTRLIPESTIKATHIDSCHEKLSDVPDNQLMHADATTDNRFPRYRIGFLRGTEFQTFKKQFQNTQDVPQYNSSNLYPDGYDYEQMVDRNGLAVSEGGTFKPKEAVAKVRINTEQPCPGSPPSTTPPSTTPPSTTPPSTTPPKTAAFKTEYIVAIVGGVVLLMVVGFLVLRKKNSAEEEEE